MKRIIDYKTGGRDFDFSGVLNAITIQLPLYLMAAAERSDTRAGLYLCRFFSLSFRTRRRTSKSATMDRFV